MQAFCGQHGGDPQGVRPRLPRHVAPCRPPRARSCAGHLGDRALEPLARGQREKEAPGGHDGQPTPGALLPFSPARRCSAARCVGYRRPPPGNLGGSEQHSRTPHDSDPRRQRHPRASDSRARRRPRRPDCRVSPRQGGPARRRRRSRMAGRRHRQDRGPRRLPLRPRRPPLLHQGDEVNELWFEIMREEFLLRPRMSRIYWNGKFLDYPLQGMDVVKKLGPIELTRSGISYLSRPGASPRAPRTTSSSGSPTASASACTSSSSSPTPRRSGASRAPRSAPSGRPSGSRACRS